jgi:hypothetical protein
VRDNIIFGVGLDEAWNRRVFVCWEVVCHSTRDLEILKSSDMTMVGERGIKRQAAQLS